MVMLTLYHSLASMERTNVEVSMRAAAADCATRQKGNLSNFYVTGRCTLYPGLEISVRA